MNDSITPLGWLQPGELIDPIIQALLDELPLVRVNDAKQALSRGINYLLTQDDYLIQLQPADKKRGGPLSVDFASGATSFRRQNGGIKQEVAKACGLKKDFRPSIIDATAGVAGDAFVLASLGCSVTLLEQNPVVYGLLASGIHKFRDARCADAIDPDVAEIVTERLSLPARQSSIDYLLAAAPGAADVVYLDPMFPERKKAAKVKKTMQYFHDIVGLDQASEAELLAAARRVAGKRVVVKRPKQAPVLADQEPTVQIASKTIRYDVYLTPVDLSVIGD